MLLHELPDCHAVLLPPFLHSNRISTVGRKLKRHALKTRVDASEQGGSCACLEIFSLEQARIQGTCPWDKQDTNLYHRKVIGASET
jgi:hypothetical protein